MDEHNMMAPEPAYSVSESSLLIKYRARLDEASYQQLLAEAAVDELMNKNRRLMSELREVQQAKEEQEQQFKAQLEDVSTQLNELRGISE